ISYRDSDEDQRPKTSLVVLSVEGGGDLLPGIGPHRYPKRPITIVPHPDPCWAFDYWTGVPDEQAHDNPLTIIPLRDSRIVAHFKFICKSLTITESGTGTGVVTDAAPSHITCPGTCEYEYDPGSTVVLTATPDALCVF